MFNNVVLIGRLVRDPEIKYTAGSGTAWSTFTLAVDRPCEVLGDPKNLQGGQDLAVRDKYQYLY